MVEKIADEEVEKYIQKITEVERDVIIKKYIIDHASDKMLGFIGEYWRLKVQIVTCENEIKWKHYFIKAISKSNVAKANMVKEMNLFEKEIFFYAIIKKKINIQGCAMHTGAAVSGAAAALAETAKSIVLDHHGMKPWSANLITSTNDAMIFEDLNNLHYKTRNKLKVYDMKHALLALNTLARLHASSLIYEDKRSRELQRPYFLNEEYPLDEGGYKISNTWFLQCMKGALEIIKTHSKYNNSPDDLRQIENEWPGVWKKSLELNEISNEYRNVICHRDLWNNNIMFRYETVKNILIPDDCILVDFAAVSYQPPASDVMFLLYCTLDPVFREENLDYLLNYYYEQLQSILYNNDVTITNIIPFKDFIMSCEEQRLWGIVASACLVPQFWIDDDLTKKIFCDAEKFNKVLNDKFTYFQAMIINNDDYKNKVMQIFEEIVDRYCFDL